MRDGFTRPSLALLRAANHLMFLLQQLLTANQYATHTGDGCPDTH